MKFNNFTVSCYESIQNAIRDFNEGKSPKYTVESMIKVITDPKLVDYNGNLPIQTPFELIPDHKFVSPSEAKGDIMVLPGMS